MPIDLDQPPHRRVIIVDWDKRDTANSWAADWDPDTGGEETFGSVKLSADGTDPPTHIACNTAATDPILDGIQNASDNVPFVAVYSPQDGETPYELWERALADMGLQVIPPPTSV